MARHIPKADRRPHIFLSHSSKDKKIVRKLAEDLTACEVDVWLDEWEIETGDSIYSAVSQALHSSRYIALIISTSFLQSKWVSEEVQAAYSRQLDDGEKIILPLLFEYVQVPTLLKGKLHLPFVENYYHSLARLAAMVHGIELRNMSSAIEKNNPSNLTQVLDTLYYCGFNPHLIIPKNVFDELASSNLVEVYEDRMIFPDLLRLLQENSTSDLAKYYLGRVWQGDRPNVQ